MQPIIQVLRAPALRGGLVGMIWFSCLWLPMSPVAAQFGGPVTIISDTAPTSLARTKNSTLALVEATKQTLQQLKIVQTGDLSYAAQVAEYAKIAGRWLETVQHYTTEIFNLVRQFTSLRGILTFAGQELGLKSDDLKAAREIIDAVQGVLAVKQQFENLLQTRLALIRNWETRAKAGIFNPRQDWEDLKNYLKTGLGRTTVNDDLLLKLREIDPEYARWEEELKRLRKREAELIYERQILLARLEREKNLQPGTRQVTTDDQGGATVQGGDRVSTSPQTVLALQNNVQQIEKQLFDVQARIQELLDKMEQRYTQAFWQMYQQWEKATAVGDTTEGWQQFGAIKLQELGNLVDHQGTPAATPPPVDLSGLGGQ